MTERIQVDKREIPQDNSCSLGCQRGSSTIPHSYSPHVHANAALSRRLDYASLFAPSLDLWRSEKRPGGETDVSDHAGVIKISFGMFVFLHLSRVQQKQQEVASTLLRKIFTCTGNLRLCCAIISASSLRSSSIIAAAQIVLNVTPVSKANWRPR